MQSKYIFPAHVNKVVDADTLDIDFSLGFGLEYKNQRVRLYGINAYEVKLYEGVTEEEKAKGLAGKAAVEEFIAHNPNVMVETFKDEKGKYGRYLATIWVEGTAYADFMSMEEAQSRCSVIFPDSYKPTLTLVNYPLSTKIDNKDYFNLNYWLCANGYALEKKY